VSNASILVYDVQLETIVVLALSLITAALIGCVIARCIAVSFPHSEIPNRSIEDCDRHVTAPDDRST
jgi:hypothetical protein